MTSLVAVTCSSEILSHKQRGLLPRYTLNTGLPKGLAVAGAQAAVLPHAHDITLAEGKAMLAGMLGLIITGGDFDLPPARYGEVAHAKTRTTAPLRSAFEATLLAAARELKLPVLGICGGMQLINVAFGGTLIQDVSLWPSALVHEQVEAPCQPSHSVRILPHTRLAQALGIGDRFGTEIMVNSTHHQVLGRLGQGLKATAWAADGVIEAIECDAEANVAPFVVGVQWHPDTIADERHDGLFRALCAAGRQRLQGTPGPAS